MAGNHNIHDYNDDNFYYCPRNDCACHGTPDNLDNLDNYIDYLHNYLHGGGDDNYDNHCGDDCYICAPNNINDWDYCCPHCGTFYPSDKHDKCPDCGYPSSGLVYLHHHNGRLNIYEHLHTGVNQFVYQHDHTDDCTCGQWPTDF
jgi:hypothetical protein